MKRVLFASLLLVCCLSISHSAQAQVVEEVPVLPELERLVVFTSEVASATRQDDCEHIMRAIDNIAPELREDAANIVAHVDRYEVSDDIIQKVAEYSKEAGSKSSTCEAIGELYRQVALRATQLRAAPLNIVVK